MRCKMLLLFVVMITPTVAALMWIVDRDWNTADNEGYVSIVRRILMYLHVASGMRNVLLLGNKLMTSH